MSTTRRTMAVDPSEVWAVLADGWLYPLWVVGASRIREVDDSWPTPTSRLHHSFGVWPAVIDDETQVMECTPLERLVLRARGWPMGEAHVDIRLEETTAGTIVTITEEAIKGPGSLLPQVIQSPILDIRNRESLWRLDQLASKR